MYCTDGTWYLSVITLNRDTVDSRCLYLVDVCTPSPLMMYIGAKNFNSNELEITNYMAKEIFSRPFFWHINRQPKSIGCEVMEVHVLTLDMQTDEYQWFDPKTRWTDRISPSLPNKFPLGYIEGHAYQALQHSILMVFVSRGTWNFVKKYWKVADVCTRPLCSMYIL